MKKSIIKRSVALVLATLTIGGSLNSSTYAEGGFNPEHPIFSHQLGNTLSLDIGLILLDWKSYFVSITLPQEYRTNIIAQIDKLFNLQVENEQKLMKLKYGKEQYLFTINKLQEYRDTMAKTQIERDDINRKLQLIQGEFNDINEQMFHIQNSMQEVEQEQRKLLEKIENKVSPEIIYGCARVRSKMSFLFSKLSPFIQNVVWSDTWYVLYDLKRDFLINATIPELINYQDIFINVIRCLPKDFIDEVLSTMDDLNKNEARVIQWLVFKKDMDRMHLIARILKRRFERGFDLSSGDRRNVCLEAYELINGIIQILNILANIQNHFA